VFLVEVQVLKRFLCLGASTQNVRVAVRSYQILLREQNLNDRLTLDILLLLHNYLFKYSSKFETHEAFHQEC